MNEISLQWLASLVLATDRRNRPHGPNLDAIKAFFDREMTNLNWIFGGISALVVTVSAALLGTLFSRLDSSISRTVATRNDDTTITDFFEESGAFGAPELTLTIVLLVLSALALGSVIANRAAHIRLHRAYATAVQVYYLMHRITP